MANENVYGRWTIIDPQLVNALSKDRLLMKCACGTLKRVRLDCVLRGLSTSCGCWRKENAARAARERGSDETGKTYGRYTVIANSPGSEVARYVEARCSCGTIKRVQLGGLRHGSTISCGCANRERLQTEKPALKHGLSHRPEYFAWYDMVDRCYNPNNPYFKDYGARGIRVCRRWKRDVSAFFADVGERPSAKHSLDRIKNNKGYTPDNVKWSTIREQNTNKRDTCLLTYQGRKQSASLWAEELGPPRHVIYDRKRRGYTDHKTLTTPVRR